MSVRVSGRSFLDVSTSDPLFSSGAMGNVVFDGLIDATPTIYGSAISRSGLVYTLTYDLHVEDMTIAAGVSVTGPYRIFVRRRLMAGVGSKIHRNGLAGGNGTATVVGAGGVILAAGTLAASSTGGSGGTVNAGVGNGSAAKTAIPRPGVAGSPVVGAGGGRLQGGSGGRNNNSDAGATSGAITLLSLGEGSIDIRAAIMGRSDSGAGWNVGTGGGGGRGGNAAGSPGSTGCGGGGGSAGGMVVVCARRIIGPLSIEAKGGAGGSGGAGSGVGVLGGAGGGGGGAGGTITLVIGDGAFPSTDVTGGAAGAGSGIGSALAGGSGGAGILYSYRAGVS